MKHTSGRIRGGRLMARLAIVLCLGFAFAAVPAIASAAPVTTDNAVASYDNVASISIDATTGVGEPAYLGTRYRFDTSEVATITAWPATAIVSISAYGLHTLEYSSVDVAGGVEVTVTRTFDIADTLPPTTISNVAAVYLDSASIVLFAADDIDGSGMAHTYYTLDDGPTVEGADITVSTFGPHTLKFWSVDNAGNMELMVFAPFEIIDSIAPVTTSDVVPVYTGGSATINLSASDNAGGSGIDATYYDLDGAGFVAGTVVNVSDVGDHTLSFYSVDLSGDEEAVQTVTFTVQAAAGDTQAPVSTSDAVATYATSPAVIELTSSDEVGGSGMASLFYRVDGGTTVEVNASGMSVAAVLTPALGIPADHEGGSAPTNCACHPGIIPAGHSAGAAPASCACHAIVAPSAPVDMPHSHEGRTGGCTSCHPADGVIMPTSATNPSHFGQSAGFVGGGACESCHTLNVLAGEIPPVSMSTTMTVSGVGAHTIEFWGADVAGNVETPHQSVSFTIGSIATEHTILSSSSAGGVISPIGSTTVAVGADATYTITPNEGFHVEDVIVDGQSVGEVSTYTFTNVTANHTISASFAANPVGTFTITPSAGAGGSITPNTVQTIASGDSSTFAITADSGFHIETVLVDGLPQSPVPGSYTFTNVTANHTIIATFSNVVDVPVPTSITLRSSDYSIRRYKLITLSSVLSSESGTEPFLGSPVRYEVKRPGSHVWVFLQTRTVDADGASHTSRRKLGYRGTYQFRVRYLGNDDFTASTSRTVKVVVR